MHVLIIEFMKQLLVALSTLSTSKVKQFFVDTLSKPLANDAFHTLVKPLLFHVPKVFVLFCEDEIVYFGGLFLCFVHVEGEY